ncbi:alpha-galactosidase [Chrysochromulina tobinii]|uniref:Alpha-galactosidase n=1 Tax=Chrysochromulina tobinii TaxID=1460289 RepID=A0A0M0JV84_9EUKA|nr:alpha-galactosidase [Chrysochromulina tobinii]|eukprot:KOO30033.1 alpha-galactosidase [Chrysochromulina sp. CCMP291]
MSHGRTIAVAATALLLCAYELFADELGSGTPIRSLAQKHWWKRKHWRREHEDFEAFLQQDFEAQELANALQPSEDVDERIAQLQHVKGPHKVDAAKVDAKVDAKVEFRAGWLPPGSLSPPMGWRSWNKFELEISQDLIQAQVDGLVRTRPGNSHSLRDVGYTSIGVDDGWQVCHDRGYHDESTGYPLVNTTLFPDLGAMTAYGHERGVKMGWYHNNCACNGAADRDRYKEDALATARYGFDAIKVDSCGPMTNITAWRVALDEAAVIAGGGKRIGLEDCRNYGYTDDVKQGQGFCEFEMFRSTEDASPDFASVMNNLLTNSRLPGGDDLLHGGLPWSRPGCWSYPDMLMIIGSGECSQNLPPDSCGADSGGVRRAGGLNVNESRAHFGAWCIVSSPLILAHDLSDEVAYAAAYPIISNTLAIRVNQVYAGDAGRLIVTSPADEAFRETVYHGARCECAYAGTEMPRWTVWAKRMDAVGNEVAALAINLSDKPIPGGTIAVNVADLFGLNGAETYAHECDRSVTAPLSRSTENV